MSEAELKPTANQNCIVLDGIFFQFRDPSGIARVWAALLEEWSDTEFGRSLLVLDRDGTVPKFPGINYLPFKSYESGNNAKESFALEDVCRQHQAKLFISTFHTTPLETTSALMVHDMIPELISGSQDPKWAAEKRFSTYHATGFIAISHHTARDLHECYPVTKDSPLCVAPNGVSKHFRPVPSEGVRYFRQKYGISKPYFLCVGRRIGHKNGKLFFNAFNKLPDRKSIAIVCCGGHETLEPDFGACVQDGDVHMLSMTDDDLNAAYAGALALVYPSKYEGFGLPILEAMASGCPVITCRNSSIPEVAGENALYVEESDTEQMLSALLKIQDGVYRERLIQAGYERVRYFSWSSTARIISGFLNDLLSFNAFRADTLGSKSQSLPSAHQRWRELRSYESMFELSRLERLLQLPRLQRHTAVDVKQVDCGQNDPRRTELQPDVQAADPDKMEALERLWVDALLDQRKSTRLWDEDSVCDQSKDLS